MADFDPDAYLATTPKPAESSFDPDAYLRGKGEKNFSWGQALTDIPNEIGNEATAGASDVAALGHRGEMGPIEGLMSVPKAVMGAARTVASPVTGALRSVLGHGMANAEHAVGSVINPEVAAKDNPEQMYETAKGDVDTAMAGARPAGAPIKVGGAYEWKSPVPAATKPTGVIEQPDTEEFFNAARNNYRNMRGYGVEFDPKAINGVADNITNELTAEGYRQRKIPNVWSDVEELRTPLGPTHEVADIMSVRDALQKSRSIPGEGDAARRAIEHIDNYLAGLKPTSPDIVNNAHFADRIAEEAKAARSNWRAGSQGEAIDEYLRRAETAASTHGNIGHQTQLQLKNLRNNKREMKFWTDAEKAELDSAIKGTVGSKAAKQAGKFAPHGIVSTLGSVAAGHAVLPGAGEAVVPAAGFIAKKIANYMTGKRVERLTNFVKGKSALGKQTSINAAAQQALTPPVSRPSMLSTGVAAALPKPHRLIMHMPQTADQGNQNPTAGFASGGGVDDDSDAGEVHPAGGIAGLAPAADSYDPFAAEKFVPEDIAQAAPQIARNLTTTQRPDKSQEHVKFKTKNPMTDISDEDIDRGMGVAMATGPGSIKAYHGSPHDFDAFDLSKIGTGEGAQAYGHGLYFAENEGVAKSYKTAGAQSGPVQFQGEGIPNISREKFGNLPDETRRALLWLRDEPSISSAISNASANGETALANEIRRLQSTGDISHLPPGKMYEVSIAADPEHFLDWDKPLKDQPRAVQEAWAKQFQNDKPPVRADIPVTEGAYVPEATGQEIYRNTGPDQLREAGIPGIKYLDQGSRSAGEGSRNYVVFNDKLVSILKKYGIAAALAPQIAQEMMQEQQPQRKSGGSIAALKTAYTLKRAK